MNIVFPNITGVSGIPLKPGDVNIPVDRGVTTCSIRGGDNL